MAFSLLAFHEKDWFETEDKFEQGKKIPILGFTMKFKIWLHCFNLIISSFMLAAFLLPALVIVAYSEQVGWVTVGAVSVFAIIFWILWVLQARER